MHLSSHESLDVAGHGGVQVPSIESCRIGDVARRLVPEWTVALSSEIYRFVGCVLGGRCLGVTEIPLPGCCHFCLEPVTRRQKAVVFEGPNLRFPQLGEDSAVFHTRQLCLRDARGYGEAWAAAVPERIPKFPGNLAEEERTRLLTILTDHVAAGDHGDGAVPVEVHMMGGEYDGACMKVSMPQAWDLYYVEPARQPAAPRRGTWYEHAADCSCGAGGRGKLTAGNHTYSPKADS